MLDNLSSISDYVRDHQGGLTQVAIGLGEVGLAYLCVAGDQTTLSGRLGVLVGAIPMGAAYVDLCYGAVRSLPSAPSEKGRPFWAFATQTPDFVRFTRDMLKPASASLESSSKEDPR